MTWHIHLIYVFVFVFSFRHLHWAAAATIRSDSCASPLDDGVSCLATNTSIKTRWSTKTDGQRAAAAYLRGTIHLIDQGRVVNVDQPWSIHVVDGTTDQEVLELSVDDGSTLPALDLNTCMYEWRRKSKSLAGVSFVVIPASHASVPGWICRSYKVKAGRAGGGRFQQVTDGYINPTGTRNTLRRNCPFLSPVPHCTGMDAVFLRMVVMKERCSRLD